LPAASDSSRSRDAATVSTSASALLRQTRAGFSVAWFDIGKNALVDLPQIYERLDETHYAYRSPTNNYEATLVMDASGFVRVYPELWQMEDWQG
jgi:hypothetical protein